MADTDSFLARLGRCAAELDPLRTAEGRRRRTVLCLADFPDLHARFRAASDTYAATDDGGYPGTAAAQAYRSELDSCWGRSCRPHPHPHPHRLLGRGVMTDRPFGLTPFWKRHP